MLKVLRDNLKFLSWILWVVIFVFIAFVFVDFGRGIGVSHAGGAAATVGDQSVSYKEFEREYRRLEDQYRQAFGGRFTPELADQLQLPMQAMDRLVNRKLLVAEADRRGLEATDQEVQQAILGIPGIQDDSGRFVGAAAYERFLQANGYTPHDFEALVREDVEIQKLTGVITDGVAVSDAEVERAWRDENEHAAVRYVLAPTTRYAVAAAPSADEVKAYFEAHRDDFRLPDRRVVDYLLVDASRLRAGIEVSPADIQRYYNEHADEFAQPEQVHARHILVKIDEKQSAEAAAQKMAAIRARLAAGEPFEKVAAETSEDPGSKSRGGDLGYFGRGRMIQEFETAAFGAKPGEIVGPIRTSFGLHLIQVLDHRAGGQQPLEEAAARIQAKLAGERADNAAEARARDLAAQVAAGPLTTEAQWQKLADGAAVTFVTTPAFGVDDPVPGIGRNPDFSTAAFALATPGAASAPVRVPRGWALLRLREIQPTHAPELAEVEARVRSAAELDKARQLATAELESARARIAAGTPFDEAVRPLGLEPKDSGDFTRTGSIPDLGPARPIADVAFGLAPGQVGGPVAVSQGAVLFELTQHKPFDPAAFAAARDGKRDELRQAEAQRLLSSLLSEQRKSVGISYDPRLVEQFKLGGTRKS
jgi:peptidyl-prolyl cis-trans isomerase D